MECRLKFAKRIPLLIRGPGIPAGTKTDAVALTIDLAPTILDMAGVQRPDFMDGKSLLPYIRVRGAQCGEGEFDRTNSPEKQPQNEPKN